MRIKIIFVFLILISCRFSFAQYAELERFDNVESFILNKKIIFSDVIKEDKKILAANRILEIRIIDANESNETIFLNKDYTADSIITNKSGTREETHFTRDSTGIKRITKKIFVYMMNSATQQSYKAFFQNANAEFFNSNSTDTIFYGDKGIVGDSSVYIFTKDKNGNPLQLVKSSADEEDKIFYGYKNGKLVSRTEWKKIFEFVKSDSLITNYFTSDTKIKFYLNNKRITKIEYSSNDKLVKTVSFRYEPNGLIESAEMFTFKDGNSVRTKLFYDYSYYED